MNHLLRRGAFSTSTRKKQQTFLYLLTNPVDKMCLINNVSYPKRRWYSPIIQDMSITLLIRALPVIVVGGLLN